MSNSIFVIMSKSILLTFSKDASQLKCDLKIKTIRMGRTLRAPGDVNRAISCVHWMMATTGQITNVVLAKGRSPCDGGWECLLTIYSLPSHTLIIITVSFFHALPTWT